MSVKLITFLGNVRKTEQNPKGYQLTKYQFHDVEEPYETCFVADAIARKFAVDEVRVFVTKEAMANHLEDLQQALQDTNIPVYPVKIETPDDSDRYIWDIFNKITDEEIIKKHDSIVFDVTLSFRSIPILAFLSNIYLQKIRETELKAIVYGEFIPGTSPTYMRDLSVFARILDWTTAVSTFQQTGRVENLAALAKNLGGEPVEQFAKQLEAFSQELLAARPVGTTWAASKLPALLEQVKNDSRPESTPLGLLLDSIAETYQQFDLNRGPLATLDATYEEAKVKDIQFLKIQLDMIKWYIKKGLPIQATTLAREWLVSLADYYQDTAVNSFSYKERDKLSRYINNFIPPSNTPKIPDIQPSSRLKQHAQGIADVWDSIRNIRNDIAHCGYDRPKAKEAAKLQAHLDSLEEMLDQLLP